MTNYPLKVPAIRVTQPLGEFFVVSLPASVVRSVTYLDPTRINKVDRVRFRYFLLGAQRVASSARAKNIAKYINSDEAAFPNSIILAANYINDGELQEDEEKRWKINRRPKGEWELIIPEGAPMASVIDGQHRLLGFDYCDEDRKDMELLCSVYVDLPHAYQAYLFATININQRKVDKSLAYEQFGYNLDDERADEWSPDKLAVFLSRKLNLKTDSPFHGHIKIAPIDETQALNEIFAESSWLVSTAAVVEGIMHLFSTNPKRDRELLHSKDSASRKRSILPADSSPWRDLYKSGSDDDIYAAVESYFTSATKYLLAKSQAKSYIHKTIGIQALFDVLAFLGSPAPKKGFQKAVDGLFSAAAPIDFADPFFQASGKGRIRVKNTLLFFAGLIPEERLPEGDKAGYLSLKRQYR